MSTRSIKLESCAMLALSCLEFPVLYVLQSLVIGLVGTEGHAV